MSKTYDVVWTNRAAKQLKALDKKQQLLLFNWVEKNLQGCANPKEIQGVKKLQGTDSGWRFRVGSYRLLTTIKDNELIIEVVRVGHRREVYSNFPKM